MPLSNPPRLQRPEGKPVDPNKEKSKSADRLIAIHIITPCYVPPLFNSPLLRIKPSTPG